MSDFLILISDKEHDLILRINNCNGNYKESYPTIPYSTFEIQGEK